MFEYFNNTIDNIIKPQNREDKDPPTYFCIRYSYEALPENSIIDTTQIKAAAANGGENTDYFKENIELYFQILMMVILMPKYASMILNRVIGQQLKFRR